MRFGLVHRIMTDALAAQGGRLAVGATLEHRTITALPPASSNTFVKFQPRHGLYAVTVPNALPTLRLIDAVDPAGDVLPSATAGQAWTTVLEAHDSDSSVLHWQLVQAPAGLTLTASGIVDTNANDYSTRATLTWTPMSKDRADSEVVVRVRDSRGG